MKDARCLALPHRPMNCPLCHFANPADARRCRSCGATLRARINENGAPSSDALPAGTLLAGAYLVEDVLGQGGFGITYRCHDRMLDRRVAVKEFFPSRCRRLGAEVAPSRGLSDTDFREARAQFLAEARTLARCHHVGIVGVYAAFEANQTAYMVMELLHGKSLAQLITARGGRMIETEAVAIIERVGEALQFVHEQNLLHRDIKPDNIIACDDGRTMLIDFGTARATIQDQVQGQTVIVTPGYAPLEQYARQAKRGAFSDIYSLAATLYHLLTGQMPPAASDRAMGVQLRPVREFNPNVSASVAHATERALQMEIARRPQSVREFLDLLHAPFDEIANGISPALQSVIKRGDLLSREDAEVEALFSPPHKSSPAVALFSDSLQAGQTQLDNLLPNASEDANKPPINPHLTTLFSDALQENQQLLGNLLPPALAQPVQLAPPRAFPLSANPPKVSTAATPVAGSGAGGVNVKDAVDAYSSGKAFAWVVGVLLVVFGIIFLVTPRSNERFASSSTSGISSSRSSASFDDPMNSTQAAAEKAWDEMPVFLPVSTETLPSGTAANVPKSAATQQKYSPKNVAFSSDGKRLAYVDNQSVLRVWSATARRVVRSLALDKNRDVERILFASDNQTITLVQKPQNDQSSGFCWTEVWNIATGKRIGVLESGPKAYDLWAQGILNDGRMLLRTISGDKTTAKMMLWNPQTGEQTSSPLPFVDQLSSSVLSPDGNELVTGSGAGILQWFDVAAGNQKNRHSMEMTQSDYDDRFSDGRSTRNDRPDDPLWIRGLKFSSDGSWLAARNDAEINVFDSNANQIGSWTIRGRDTISFAVSPMGQRVAARGSLLYGPDANMLWDVNTNQKTRLEGAGYNLLGLGFSSDGKQLYGISSDGKQFHFSAWDVNAKTTASFANPQKTSFQPAGMHISPFAPIAQSGDLTAMPVQSSVEIRRQDGTLVNTLNIGNSSVATMDFSSDGQLLAISKFDGPIQIWNVNQGTLMGQLNAAKFARQGARNPFGAGKSSSDMVFSPDNKFFVCERFGSDSSVVELWSLEGQPRRLTSLAQKENRNALAFSPDSKILACGGEKGLVQLYDVATHQLQTQLRTAGKVLDIVGTPENWVVVGAAQTTTYRFSSDSKPQLQQVSQVAIPLQLELRPGLINGAAFQWAVSPDGQLLATAEMSAHIRIFDLKTGFLLQSLDTDNYGTRTFPPDQCTGLKFSADGSQLTSLGTSFSERSLSVVTWSRIIAS